MGLHFFYSIQSTALLNEVFPQSPVKVVASFHQLSKFTCPWPQVVFLSVEGKKSQPCSYFLAYQMNYVNFTLLFYFYPHVAILILLCKLLLLQYILIIRALPNKFNSTVLVCSGCYKSTIDRIAYKQQKVISQTSGAWESETRGYGQHG